jgi:hypothetical protein
MPILWVYAMLMFERIIERLGDYINRIVFARLSVRRFCVCRELCVCRSLFVISVPADLTNNGLIVSLVPVIGERLWWI